MKQEQKKSVPIELSIWRQLSQEKLDSGRDIYVIIRDLWNDYASRKNGLQEATQGIYNKDGASQEIMVANIPTEVPELAGKYNTKTPTRVEQLWLMILQDILESDHPTAVPAIKSNLQAFGELIRIARGEEVDAIRAFFKNAFTDFGQDARELQADGTRPQNSKGNSSKRRGAA